MCPRIKFSRKIISFQERTIYGVCNTNLFILTQKFKSTLSFKCVNVENSTASKWKI